MTVLGDPVQLGQDPPGNLQGVAGRSHRRFEVAAEFE